MLMVGRVVGVMVGVAPSTSAWLWTGSYGSVPVQISAKTQAVQSTVSSPSSLLSRSSSQPLPPSLTFAPQLWKSVGPVSRLQNGGLAREEGVDEPPTLEEGRRLSLHPAAILEDSEGISIVVLAHIILTIRLKQPNTCNNGT